MRRTFIITILVAGLAAPLALFPRAQRQVPARAVERVQREVRHELLMLAGPLQQGQAGGMIFLRGRTNAAGD